MENASKALIIAGAILISILLISVGIIVMNAINNPVQEGANAADAQAIEIFNGKFSGYMGTQKGTTIKALYTAVSSTKRVDDAGNRVGIQWDGPAIGTIQDNAPYTVTMEDTDNDGYYDVCRVAQ